MADDTFGVVACIVGLLATAGTVHSLLSPAVTDAAAPSRTAQDALKTVDDVSLVLEAVERLVSNLDRMPAERKELVRLDHFVVVLTQCVYTLAELESLVRKIAAGRRPNQGRSRIAGGTQALRFARVERKVQRCTAALETHRASMTAMLNIMQCATTLEALRSRDELTQKMNSMEAILMARIRHLEVVSAESRSVRFFDDSQSELNPRWSQISISDGSTPAPRPSHGRFRSLSLLPSPRRPSFEVSLEESRVYSRVTGNEIDASITSSVARTNAWSMLSGLTLTAISMVSVMGLPITLANLNAIDSDLTMATVLSSHHRWDRAVDLPPPRTPRVRCLLVGDPESTRGLCNALAALSRPDSHVPVIFDDYKVPIRVYGQMHNICLQDISATDSYEHLRKQSYERTDVILLCGNRDRPSHWNKLLEIMIKEVHPFVTKFARCPVLLVSVKDHHSKTMESSEPVFGSISSIAGEYGVSKTLQCDLGLYLDVQKVFHEAVTANIGAPDTAATPFQLPPSASSESLAVSSQPEADRATVPGSTTPTEDSTSLSELPATPSSTGPVTTTSETSVTIPRKPVAAKSSQVHHSVTELTSSVRPDEFEPPSLFVLHDEYAFYRSPADMQRKLRVRNGSSLPVNRLPDGR